MSEIVSKPATEAYRDGWDRVFGKQERSLVDAFDDVCRTNAPRWRAEIDAAHGSAARMVANALSAPTAPEKPNP